MSRKKRKKRRRIAATPPRDNQPTPRKRRLPAPKMAGGRGQKGILRQRQTAPAVDNPYVTEIVRLIQQVSIVSHLSPHIVLTDWIGMMEASLRMWAENMKAMAITGQFVEDPPEIKEIYARARARYTRISARYPAVYRMMQEIFPQTFALLLDSAGPGRAVYSQQVELNPDVIGQVFITSLDYPAAWRPFFPPWRECLAIAGDTIPDGGELVYTELARAALRARCDGHTITLEPGLNFEAWYEVIAPYVEPYIVGPSLIDSGTMLLAIASRFPGWTVQHGLVRFNWGHNFTDPLLEKMVAFNAMIFNLNAYLLEHIEAVADIQAHFEQQAGQEHPALARLSPAQVYRIAGPETETTEPESENLETETPPASHPPTPPPDTQSFSDLFRQGGR